MKGLEELYLNYNIISMEGTIRTKIEEAIVSNLRDTYFCNREWSAWDMGIMCKDDFKLVESGRAIEDMIDEIVAIIYDDLGADIDYWLREKLKP